MLKQISNVSSTLIINSYEGFYARDGNADLILKENIFNKYNAQKLTNIARCISKTIKTEILHESSHAFEPFGDSSSLLLQADLGIYNSASLHLKESHITFHTYIEDILDNFLIIRLELHISSCSEANVFESLKDIISADDDIKIFPNLLTIDYLRRGAKYGENSSIIINDNYNILDIDVDSNYDIFSNNVSNKTKSSLLLLSQEAMLNKHQSENNFMSIEAISALRNFLLKSYAEEFLVTDSADVGLI
jgi:S-adenosylmethionine/arginine decarboxylase-like enzyme